MSRAEFSPADVLDMSAGGSRSATVMAFVGKERCEFHISQLLLDAKSIKLSNHDDTQGAIHARTIGTTRQIFLPNDDAAAFNLFVQWLHGYDLPQVQAQRTQSHEGGMTLNGMLTKVPESIDFRPILVRQSPFINLWDCFQHVCFSDDYMRFSPEEIRLSNMMRSPSTIAPSSQSRSSGNYQATATTHVIVKRENSPDLSMQAEKKQKTEVTSENEQIQFLLLNLALLAQKYGWSECFNTAMGSYRAGEKSMKRTYPVLSHIELVYSVENPTNSPAIRLLADYAFHKGTRSGIAQYHSAFLQKPAFMRDYHSRLDGAIIVPGCRMLRVDGNLTFSISFPGPLDGEYSYYYRIAN